MWTLLLAAALAAPPHPSSTEELAAWASTSVTADPTPEGAQGYRFTGELFSEVATAAQARPGAVTTLRLGTSHRGRPIWALQVTEPATVVEREVLVFAGLHALEWIGVEAATEWLLELIDEPPRGTRVTVVPVVNPDGRARVEADLLAGRNTYRRGNRNHVDLNRDFSAHRNESTAWQALLPRRYSTSPGPLSQPETRALEALADTIDFDVVISLHAFGGYLYHPWAGRWQRPEDWAAYVAAGRRMEEAQTAHAYRTRQLSRWGFFFRALGTELDHFAAVHGSQSWLIETTRSGWDPRRPFASVRTYFRWYNPRTPEPHSARVVAALRTFLPTESAPFRGRAPH